MRDVSLEAGQAIAMSQGHLAEAIMSRQCAFQPELMAQYDETARAKCIQDIHYHLSYLAGALYSSSPALWADYLAWAKVLLSNLGLPDECLNGNVECIRAVLLDELPGDLGKTAAEYVQQGMETIGAAPTELPSFIRTDNPHATLAARYLDALLRGERQAASRLILDAVQGGVSVRDIYRYVFQPVQHEIGRLWQMNRISVAQEHYCTAATQLVMSQLYPFIFTAERKDRRLVATCVSGELHEVGVRMVADLFEMAGWDTYYLGSNTPTDSVIRTLIERKAEVLGVSATITWHVGQVASLLEAVERAGLRGQVRILVGGYPFNIAPDLWQKLGADGYAPDASRALSVAEELLTAHA